MRSRFSAVLGCAVVFLTLMASACGTSERINVGTKISFEGITKGLPSSGPDIIWVRLEALPLGPISSPDEFGSETKEVLTSAETVPGLSVYDPTPGTGNCDDPNVDPYPYSCSLNLVLPVPQGQDLEIRAYVLVSSITPADFLSGVDYWNEVMYGATTFRAGDPQNLVLQVRKWDYYAMTQLPPPAASSEGTESLGTGDGSATSFGGTLTNLPAGEGTLLILVDGRVVGRDDFQGNLKSGNTGLGTVDYMAGTVSLTFPMAPPSGAAVEIRYNQVQAGPGYDSISGTATIPGSGDSRPNACYSPASPMSAEAATVAAYDAVLGVPYAIVNAVDTTVNGPVSFEDNGEFAFDNFFNLLPIGRKFRLLGFYNGVEEVSLGLYNYNSVIVNGEELTGNDFIGSWGTYPFANQETLSSFGSATFTGSTALSPIEPGSFVMFDPTGDQRITDDGNGALIGDVNPSGNNTISYDGSYDATFASLISSGNMVLVNYDLQPVAIGGSVPLVLTECPATGKVKVEFQSQQGAALPRPLTIAALTNAAALDTSGGPVNLTIHHQQFAYQVATSGSFISSQGVNEPMALHQEVLKELLGTPSIDPLTNPLDILTIPTFGFGFPGGNVYVPSEIHVNNLVDPADPAVAMGEIEPLSAIIDGEPMSPSQSMICDPNANLGYCSLIPAVEVENPDVVPGAQTTAKVTIHRMNRPVACGFLKSYSEIRFLHPNDQESYMSALVRHPDGFRELFNSLQTSDCQRFYGGASVAGKGLQGPLPFAEYSCYSGQSLTAGSYTFSVNTSLFNWYYTPPGWASESVALACFDMDKIFEPRLLRIDPATGDVTTVASTAAAPYLSGITFDASLSKAFAVVGDYSSGGPLYQVTLVNGALAAIGSNTIPFDAIASDGAGNLYAVTTDYNYPSPVELYTINPSTGVASLVGSLDAGYTAVSDLTWANGKLYGWTPWNGSTWGNLIEINTSTGAVTFVGSGVSNDGIGLAANAAGLFHIIGYGTSDVIETLALPSGCSGMPSTCTTMTGPLMNGRSGYVLGATFAGGMIYALEEDLTSWNPGLLDIVSNPNLR